MEPDKKWLLWTRWLLLMSLLVLVMPVMVRTFLEFAEGDTLWMAWIGIFLVVGLALYLLLSHKPIKQRVVLASSGGKIELMLSMNFFRQIEMRAFDGKALRIQKLGNYHGLPIWFEPSFDIAGEPQTLLLYFRFPDGFLVTPRKSAKALAVISNEICL